MEIRQLRHAVAVVDEGGFTAAADTVGITQPALSQSIAALERELGISLFVRGRQVALTAAGEAFLGPARQALRAADTVREVAADITGPLAELVGRFRASHPAVTVRIDAPDLRVAVLDQVRRGDAELGLAEVVHDVAGLEVHPVAAQEVVLVAPPGTRLAQSRRVPRSRLGELDLVSTPVGTSTRALLDEACATAGVEPRVVVETAHREALAPLVVAGAGAALLAAPQARQAAAGGAVVARLDPPLQRQVGFLHRQGPLSPAAEAFLALAPTPREPSA
jgi:LysR family transcriptional regulator, carnitine catabolism transcriptional activator